MKSIHTKKILFINLARLVFCLSMLLFPNKMLATQPESKLKTSENPGCSEKGWAMETSLTFPVAGIYMLKFSHKKSERVELGIGPAFQNWRNEDKSPMGQTNAYTLVLSYRYYFWKNFNAEIELWPAWNCFESFYDNNTYKGFELWAEYKLGYRFDLSSRWYLNLQPGIGHAIWMQNKWPDIENDNYWEFLKGSVIFVPQLLAGFRF